MMVRRLAASLVLLGALVAVASASGAFPGPYAVQGGNGTMSKDGSLRFVATGKGGTTLVGAYSTSEGSAPLRSATVPGSYGVPVLTPDGPGEGLFHDGSSLVLQSMGIHPSTEFVVLRTNDLSTRDVLSLPGTFGYDAVSPDGTRLYFIQHSSVQDIQHYIVRAYDLRAHKLLPGRIADKTQKNWVMQGWAVSRVTSPNGRWVYTLYANPGGTPFIHALDTVKGIAHCVGIPWPATDPQQNQLFQAELTLTGSSLAVRFPGADVYRLVNTHSWRVTKKR
jgi:hypothetical protein